MVFCRSPQQAGASDIDQFDCLAGRHLGICKGSLERIETDDHRVKKTDLVFIKKLEIITAIPSGEQPRKDLGMQRLDAAVEHLRETRDV